MNKYVTLDTITNYLPEVVKDEVQLAQIKSWAFNYYRTVELPVTTNRKIKKLEVHNGVVNLPSDIVRITGAYLGVSEFSEEIEAFEEGTTENIIIQQKIFFDRVKDYMTPLKYIGQNSCCMIDYYCSDCAYMFSINNQISELFTDCKSTHIYLAYTTYVEDGDELLIPDSPYLQQALAAYVEYMYCRNNTYRHEANSQNMMNDALVRANTFMKAFKSSEMMRSLDVKRLDAFINQRNKYETSYRRKTTNSTRRFL